MIQVKAKFYPETQLIVPLEPITPSLTELEDKPKVRHPTSGSDENGDWVLVNFVHDKDAYFDYTVESIKNDKGQVVQNRVKETEVGEKEWQQM